MTSSFSPYHRRNPRDSIKTGPVSWPRICPAARLGLIPQKDHGEHKKRFYEERSSQQLGGRFSASALLVAELFDAPLLFCIINSMQMFLRGVGLFVDLLDVASGSQGLMLNRYLRLEEAVMNVNS